MNSLNLIMCLFRIKLENWREPGNVSKISFKKAYPVPHVNEQIKYDGTLESVNKKHGADGKERNLWEWLDFYADVGTVGWQILGCMTKTSKLYDFIPLSSSLKMRVSTQKWRDPPSLHLGLLLFTLRGFTCQVGYPFRNWTNRVVNHWKRSPQGLEGWIQTASGKFRIRSIVER